MVSRNPGISQYSPRTRATSGLSGGLGPLFAVQESAFVLQPMLDLREPLGPTIPSSPTNDFSQPRGDRCWRLSCVSCGHVDPPVVPQPSCRAVSADRSGSTLWRRAGATRAPIASIARIIFTWGNDAAFI